MFQEYKKSSYYWEFIKMYEKAFIATVLNLLLLLLLTTASSTTNCHHGGGKKDRLWLLWELLGSKATNCSLLLVYAILVMWGTTCSRGGLYPALAATLLTLFSSYWTTSNCVIIVPITSTAHHSRRRMLLVVLLLPLSRSSCPRLRRCGTHRRSIGFIK